MKQENLVTEEVMEKDKQSKEVVANEQQKTPKKEKKAEPKKAKKQKEQSKLGKKVKETASELKKVNWPTAGSVIKKTGIVLAVVLIFAVVLFGIDRLLSWLFELLTNPMV